jgi:tRNA pseudouridine55 synthase
VTVHRADLLEAGDGVARYEIECSSGTYVRTLVESLEDAYCSELRRTAVGPIGIDLAGQLLPPLEALSFLARIELDDADARAIGYGQKVVADPSLPEGDPVALVNGDNLIAVATRSADTLRPEVVMEPSG